MKNRHGVEMKKVTVTLPQTDHEKLATLSAQENTTMSDIIRSLVRQRVEHL